ncbi:MAG: hypothetical protein ACU843_16350 [Gammaproteobacteria bacterium]
MEEPGTIREIGHARAQLTQEARALLSRLALVKPFALTESALPAANASISARRAIDRYLISGRKALRVGIEDYIKWLDDVDEQRFEPAEGQRRLSLLRLGFNATLAQFDIFADALTQRSEYETGVWLAGLDIVAADALRLDDYYSPPPLLCYLDRGAGAAIRRARTRLPGGGANPVAVVRVPRERMVGSGIASSLVHEVGHQAAALLDLVNSLRLELRRHEMDDPDSVWRYWERCLSEIVADFWSIAKVGITSTSGLIGVVSLPRAFVFRINLDDPHPFPWIRVMLSATIGETLFPGAEWQRLRSLWQSYYPTQGLDERRLDLVERLVNSMPEFVRVLVNHRPPALRGLSLAEVLDVPARAPHRLAAHFERWRREPKLLYRAPPTLAFAVIGQARAENRMSAEQESAILMKLLTHWALRGTLIEAENCVRRAASRDDSARFFEPKSRLAAMA